MFHFIDMFFQDISCAPREIFAEHPFEVDLSRFFILISEMKHPKDAMKVGPSQLFRAKLTVESTGGLVSPRIRNGLLCHFLCGDVYSVFPLPSQLFDIGQQKVPIYWRHCRFPSIFIAPAEMG